MAGLGGQVAPRLCRAARFLASSVGWPLSAAPPLPHRRQRTSLAPRQRQPGHRAPPSPASGLPLWGPSTGKTVPSLSGGLSPRRLSRVARVRFLASSRSTGETVPSAPSGHCQEPVAKAPLWRGPTFQREDTVFPVRRLRHCPSRDRGQGGARLLLCLAVPAGAAARQPLHAQGWPGRGPAPPRGAKIEAPKSIPLLGVQGRSIRLFGV